MKCRTSFDSRRIVRGIRNGSIKSLASAGAYLRRVAINKVKKSKSPSVPGSPPNSRRGLLRRAILFSLNQNKTSVVIGPAYSLIGDSVMAHEFGGQFRKRTYPKRPLMGPSLIEIKSKLPDLWGSSLK